MLADWLNEAGRKAIEKMGWPEWQHEHDAESLQRLVLIEIGDGTCGWSFDKIFTIDQRRYVRNEECPERAALALLRDRAREWLAERGGEVCLHEKEWYATWGGPPVSWISEPDGMPQYFADYDLALIAAVLSTEPT